MFFSKVSFVFIYDLTSCYWYFCLFSFGLNVIRHWKYVWLACDMIQQKLAHMIILFCSKGKKTAILHCSTHHLRTSTLKNQLSVNCQEKINICSNVPLEFDYFDVQSNTLSEKITMKVVNNSHGNDWANEKKPVEFRISLDELVNIAALSYRPTVTR